MGKEVFGRYVKHRLQSVFINLAAIICATVWYFQMSDSCMVCNITYCWSNQLCHVGVRFFCVSLVTVSK